MSVPLPALLAALALALALPALAPRAEAQTTFRRVGYINYPVGSPWGWGDLPQLFHGTYTHLILAFLLPDADGSIRPVDAALTFNPELIARAQAAGTKVMVSIGGATVSYAVYIDLAQDAERRRLFIDNVLVFLLAHGLDGVDVNFEGWWNVGDITSAELAQVDALVRDLATAVKQASPRHEVSVALAPLYYLPVSISCELVNSDLIDWAHHMGYDFGGPLFPNGPFRNEGKEADLYWSLARTEASVWGGLDYLASNRACLRRKLAGGIPFYGSNRTDWNALRDRARWDEIPLHPQYLEKPHPEEGWWVNDREAVAAKVRRYKQMALGGVMVWQVGHEGPRGDLSRALYEAALDVTLPIPECSDGIDNDGDELTDYPRDPHCDSTWDEHEAGNSGSTQDGTLSLHYLVTEDWGTGYCAQCLVTNLGPESVYWGVFLPFRDTITSFWEGEYTISGAQLFVQGVEWNRLLPPGQSVSFGFCAKRGGAPPPQCFDFIDNDGDGFVDFPQDPDCDAYSDDDEYPPLAILNARAIDDRHCELRWTPRPEGVHVEFSPGPAGGAGDDWVALTTDPVTAGAHVVELPAEHRAGLLRLRTESP